MISLLDVNGDLTDRLKEVVDRPENGHADVTFSVGGQRFGGLRSILGLHSEVMHRMLFGEFLEARKQEPIQLEQFDHAPGPFREFLHFMHTGKADIDDMTDMSEVLEMSKYFGVTLLIDCIIDKVRKAPISSTNAVMLAGFAAKHITTDFSGCASPRDRQARQGGKCNSKEKGHHPLSAKDLLKNVWSFIGQNADDALADCKAVVKSLPHLLLRQLFQSSSSNVSEITLIRILAELDPELQSELSVHVRLPLVPAKDMLDIVLPSKLFDTVKCTEALAFQLDPSSTKMPDHMISRRVFGATRTSMSKGGSKGAGGQFEYPAYYPAVQGPWLHPGNYQAVQGTGPPYLGYHSQACSNSGSWPGVPQSSTDDDWFEVLHKLDAA